MTRPPGTPSNAAPAGVVAMCVSHCASSVAVSDWRARRRWRVRKERRSSQLSREPRGLGLTQDVSVEGVNRKEGMDK
jgi:hypothetical protein